MNRPYNAVDVLANLKGAIPKTGARKILVTLTERGDLVQRHTMVLNMHIRPGMSAFFAPNQANGECRCSSSREARGDEREMRGTGGADV